MAGIFPIPHILPIQNLTFFRFKTSHSSDLCNMLTNTGKIGDGEPSDILKKN